MIEPVTSTGCYGDPTRTWEKLTIEDYGLRDEKGRTVGGYAHIQKTQLLARIATDGTLIFPTWVKDPVGHNGTWRYDDGAAAADAAHIVAFDVEIRATRNGATFGAIPRSTYYATIEQARVAARKGLDNQRKRYAKKYAGGGAA